MKKTTFVSFLHYLEKDNFSDLQKKVEILQNLQNSVERNTDLLLHNRINICPRNNVFEDIKNLVEYLKRGKGLGVPFFRPQIIKEHPYLLEIKFNGNKLRKLEDFNTCLQYISAYNEYVELQKYLGDETKGISDIKAVLGKSKELLSDLELIFQIYENILPIKEILYECDLWTSIFKPHASLYDVLEKYELINNLKSVLAYLEHKERLDKLSKAFPGYDLNLLNDDNLAKNVDKTCKRLQEILSLENHANALKKTFGILLFILIRKHLFTKKFFQR